MSNKALSDFMEKYSNLKVPKGLSKNKEGFFEGVVNTIKNILQTNTLDATRAKNVAENWFKIMNSQANESVVTLALESGFDHDLWDCFAKVGKVNFESKIKDRKDRKERFENKYNRNNRDNRDNRDNKYSRTKQAPHYVGHVVLNIGEEEECNDGKTRYRLTTSGPVRVNCENCSVPRYGYSVPSFIMDRFFENKSMEKQHVFRVEWNFDEQNNRYRSQVTGVADDEKPDILPYQYDKKKDGSASANPQTKLTVVHKCYCPMTVTQNDDNSYRVTTPPFKLTSDNGRTYFLSKVVDTDDAEKIMYGFKSIPENIMKDMFKDLDCEIVGKHTFEVLWRTRKHDGKDFLYSILGSVDDSVETSLEYIDLKTFKPKDKHTFKSNKSFTKSIEETIALKNKVQSNNTK